MRRWTINTLAGTARARAVMAARRARQAAGSDFGLAVAPTGHLRLAGRNDTRVRRIAPVWIPCWCRAIDARRVYCSLKRPAPPDHRRAHAWCATGSPTRRRTPPCPFTDRNGEVTVIEHDGGGNTAASSGLSPGTVLAVNAMAISTRDQSRWRGGPSHLYAYGAVTSYTNPRAQYHSYTFRRRRPS